MKSSREQFEEWFIKQYPKSRNGVATWSGEGDGDYISDYAASHWLAWQASRAAIEIELQQFDHFQICHYGADEKYADGYIDAQNNANKAIDAAGLKVKQ